VLNFWRTQNKEMSEPAVKKKPTTFRPNYIKQAYSAEKKAQFKKVKNQPQKLEEEYEVVALKSDGDNQLSDIIRPQKAQKPEVDEEEPVKATRQKVSYADIDRLDGLIKKMDEYHDTYVKLIDLKLSEFQQKAQQTQTPQPMNISIKMPETPKKQINPNIKNRIMRV